MTRRACERAAAVARLEGGPLTADLRNHVAECADCRRARGLSETFRRIPVWVRPEEGPSAGLLWWKARLARRERAEERAFRPVTLAEAIVPPALLCGLGLWLVRESALWASWLRPVAGEAAGALTAGAAALAFLAAGIVAGVSLGSALRDRRTSRAG